MINVGNDFGKSRSDDFFYIPRPAFDNEDIKTGMELMMSPDGKADRSIVTHEGNAMGPEGIAHVAAFPDAIKIALKETSLAGGKIYIGGLGSNNKDIQAHAKSDLLTAAIAAFALIFLIMLVITRSLVATLITPGTVAVGSDYDDLLLIGRLWVVVLKVRSGRFSVATASTRPTTGRQDVCPAYSDKSRPVRRSSCR